MTTGCRARQKSVEAGNSPYRMVRKGARGTLIAHFLVKQAKPSASSFQPIKEGRIMSKAISTLIAAAAALALSGGAYAQTAGGSNGSGSTGSTASPANQVNGATGGYGTPGTTNSESGMGARAPNSGLPSSTNSTATPSAPPTSNNTLATPSVVSPAAGKQ
jgi:hypothetical protein